MADVPPPSATPVPGGPSDDWLDGTQEVVIGPDAWNQGFFADLAQGTHISLAPGKYRGTISVSKGFHLTSLDPKNPAIIFAAEAPDHEKTVALTLTGSSPVKMTNLVFRGENFSNQTLLALGPVPLVMENCQFRGAYECALAVSGPGAEPQVRRCTIHGGAVGVLVEAGAGGIYEDSEILDHLKCSVVVRDQGSNPCFRNNKIHDAQQNGVHISTGALGNFEQNDIYGNLLSNVVVKDPGTAPIFRDNRVRDGQRGGFFLLEGASGTYEGNRITGHSAASVEIKDRQTDPTFLKNIITEGRQGGVSIYAGAAGRFENNEIAGHQLANVFIFQQGTNPFFKGNRIHSGNHAGISIYGTATGTFEDNDIYNNAQANVLVAHGGTNPTFQGNKVHNGKQGGIFIHGGASGTYLDNEVNDNAMANVEVLDEGTSPVFKGNRVHSCLNEGLFIQNGARGKYDGNDFRANGFSTKGLKSASPGYPSIRITGKGTSPIFISNSVIGFATAAIEISAGAGGVYERNSIRDLDPENHFVFDKKWVIKWGTHPKKKENFD